MKAKYVVLTVIAVLCAALIIIGVIWFVQKQKADDTVSYQGSAYLDGELLFNENVTIHSRENSSGYATLPFVELLKKLGFSVEWQDSLTAKIGYEDKYYILSLADNSNPSLTLIDDDQNLLLPAPGSNCRYIKVIEKDVILDDPSINTALVFMDVDIYLLSEIDYESKSINFRVQQHEE